MLTKRLLGLLIATAAISLTVCNPPNNENTGTAEPVAAPASVEEKSITVVVPPSQDSATAREIAEYSLCGTCGRTGSDQNSSDDEFLEIYYSFGVIDPEAPLRSTLEPCPDSLLAEYVEFARINAEEYAIQAIEAGNKGDWWWKDSVQAPISLEAIRCSILRHDPKANGLVVLRTEMDAKRQDNVNSNQLLSLMRVNHENRLTALALQYLTTKSPYDIRRDVSVKFICDLDEDSKTEIILKDMRYAGFNYWACDSGDDFSDFECKFFDGMRGD